MPEPIRFHFDFSSPYGYLASQRIEALAARHGRAVVWQRERDPGACAPLVTALYRAYFVADRDISDPDVAADVAAETGASREGARAAIDDPAIKDALRRDVDDAIAKGVFGSPFVFVDSEPFWGLDRFDQIDRRLAHGGF